MGEDVRGGPYRLGRLGGGESLPSQQLGSRCLVYLSQTNIDQSRGGIRPMIFVFPIRRFSFGTFWWGNTKISLQSANTPSVPFKCLVRIINCLIMCVWVERDGYFAGWGDRGEGNRYHRNSAEAGALCKFPKPTSARAGGNQTRDLCISDT